MDPLPVVRASALLPVAGWLRSRGLSTEAFSVPVGLFPEALDRPDRVIPERAFWALLDRIREREGVADVGFQIGASHHVTDLDNLGPILGGHATLLRTLQAFCALLQSHANYWDYWIEPVPGGIRLCRRGSPIDVGQWAVEQYVVSYLVDVVRMAAPPSWWPGEIWLQTKAPLLEERRWLREARLHFAGPVTAILVPDALLGRRPRALRGDRAPADDAPPISREFLPALREILRSYLPTGRVRLGDIGRATGLHPRTLQRRLAEADSSFQGILDAVRLEAACAALEGSDVPVTEIAFDLGYQEISAFSRSFRRWTGVSPRVYREANQVADAPTRAGPRQARR